MVSIDVLMKDYFKKINTKKEHWRIEKIGSILDIGFICKKYEALFLFTYEDDKQLKLINIDRSIQGPRRQGYGMKTLKTLESSLQEVGRIKNKDTIIQFEEIENQTDTKNWLIKNNYLLEDNKCVKQIYSK